MQFDRAYPSSSLTQSRDRGCGPSFLPFPSLLWADSPSCTCFGPPDATHLRHRDLLDFPSTEDYVHGLLNPGNRWACLPPIPAPGRRCPCLHVACVPSPGDQVGAGGPRPVPPSPSHMSSCATPMPATTAAHSFCIPGNDYPYVSLEAMLGNNTDLRYVQSYIFNPYLMDPSRYVAVPVPQGTAVPLAQGAVNVRQMRCEPMVSCHPRLAGRCPPEVWGLL